MSRWKPDAEGRLIEAAITLFEGQGYDQTTVAQIADAAGLTKRTFFRYFTDKREVLFNGAHELQECWLAGIAAAAPEASPMAAVFAGLDNVAAMFVDRHSFAALRSGIISSHPELQERELIKLQLLADAVGRSLVDRGVPVHAAALASQTGVTVFHVAFAHWLDQDDPAALRPLMEASFAELRTVISAE